MGSVEVCRSPLQSFASYFTSFFAVSWDNKLARVSVADKVTVRQYNVMTPDPQRTN